MPLRIARSIAFRVVVSATFKNRYSKVAVTAKKPIEINADIVTIIRDAELKTKEEKPNDTNDITNQGHVRQHSIPLAMLVSWARLRRKGVPGQVTLEPPLLQPVKLLTRDSATADTK